MDFGIKAELTATRRTGIHQYTFPKDEKSQIHIDLGYALNWDTPTETYLKVVNYSTIEGYRRKLLEKTNSKNLAGLVVFALKLF